MADFGRGNDEPFNPLPVGPKESDVAHAHDDVDASDRAHHHTIGHRRHQAASGAELAALQALVATLCPVGTISACAGPAPTADWLIMDGSVFSAATYPALAAYLGGTTLPDARDRALVGASGTKPLLSIGGSATRALSAANISHTHGIPPSADHVHSITAGGGHSHDFSAATIAANTPTTGANNRMTGGGSTGTQPDHAHGGNTGAGGAHDHGGFTNNVTLGVVNSVDIQNPYLAVNYMIRAR